jgi:hypothetical protein
VSLLMSSFGIEQCDDATFGVFFWDWVRHCGGPKSITSIDLFFELFLKNWGPPCQDHQSTLNNHLENKEDQVCKIMETILMQEHRQQSTSVEDSWAH